MGSTRPTESPIRILYVEDNPEIAECVAAELRVEGFTVAVESDGMRGLMAARQQELDLIILDRMLPNMDGTDVCQRIRQTSDIPIIMVTALVSTRERVEGLDLGANDYLCKPFSVEELIARIYAQLRSRKSQPKTLQTFEDLSLDVSSREVYRGERRIDLTPKEFDLLSYLMSGPRQVRTRSQILTAVWGYDFDGETNVVDVYIRYLRAKIADPESASLIQTVRGIGYVLRTAEVPPKA